LHQVEGYPGCCVEKPEWVGDDDCDGGIYNTKECEYDGGDCEPPIIIDGYPVCSYGLHQVEGYPGCCVESPEWIGDGECDWGTYMTEECGLDGGDCTCLAADPEQCGCGSVQQRDFRGTINVTESGYACEQWSADWIAEEHGYDYVQRYPNSGLENNNYCRTLDGYLRPGCFIKREHHQEAGTDWEYCNVPFCMTGPEGCSDLALEGDEVSEESISTCNYHQCAGSNAIDQPSLDTFFSPTLDEVEPTCQCVFEIWDCAYGSLDCERNFFTKYEFP
jgi:hypothetical protein